MDFGKVASGILGAVAPVLGTAIGGPFGGMVASKLSEILLGKSDGSKDEIEQALEKASPQQLLEIKKANNEFLVKMKELDVDVERLHSEDRNSARNREIQVRDKMPAILGILTLVSFFGFIGMVTFSPLARGADMNFITLAVGWLGGTASTVVSYYFGSSSGSQMKNTIIANKLEEDKKK